jgi:GntP family gluconate:H+ symporter
VLLAVNMQTSFMHPPFGFALFYLRSVAPSSPFRDHVTGKLTDPVTTGQIYWGAIPFVVIQVVMVGLIIAFPQLVGHDKQMTDAQMEQQGQAIDIQKMLQEDAAKDATREAEKAGDGAAANDGDALTKALREANKPQ